MPLQSKEFFHAPRQTDHCVPAGPGRCPEPGGRARQPLRRTGPPAGGHAGAARRAQGPARPRRRQHRGAEDRDGQPDQRPAQRAGRRPGAGRARPGAVAAGRREGSRQARRPVHRQRDVPAGAGRCQERHRRHRARPRPDAQGADGGGGGRARRPEGGFGRVRRPARGAEEVHAGPDRARAQRQARPGDRPRRRDPPRHPGAAAAHQEQPGADRRARRGQDRHRRRPGAAHRQRRGARVA